MDAVDTAELVSAGLSVLPLRLDGTKAPAIKEWKQFQNERPHELELKRWGTRGGVGIVCGKVSGNLEIIDIDDAGLLNDYLEQIEALGGSEVWHKLTVVKTPRPGYHLLYRMPEPPQGNQKLAMQSLNGKQKTLIETRGEGGYVVAVGSNPAVHESNKPYLFVQGDYSTIPMLTMEERALLLNAARSLSMVDFAEIEGEDRMISQRSKLPVTRDTTDGARGQRPGDEFAERVSWQDILEPMGWQIVKRRGDVIFWRQPQKQNKGHSATTGYGSADILYVFSSNAAPFDPGRGYQKFTAYALLHHGADFSAAARDLRAQGYGVVNQVPATIEKTLEAGITAAPLPFDNTELQFTDRANGLRFARDWGHCVRHAKGHGWMIYTEKYHWEPSPARASEAAWHTAAKLYNEINNLEPAERERYMKAAKRLHSMAGHTQMLAAAATFPGIFQDIQDFDGPEYDNLLNCQNGIVDLSTNELIAHDSRYLITKQANVAWDDKATCPLFDDCLNYWFEGDTEMIDFFWRWVGYTLTGYTHFEHFVFLEGPGGNGKTIARETIVNLMGTYVKTLPKTALMVSHLDQTTAITRALGARMIAVSEVNSGDRLDEGRTKDLVSGEMQPARLLYQDGFDFKPCGKLWMHGNHRPRITDTTESIWRRLLTVPFHVIIPPEKRDPNLRYKTLQEKPGILNRAIAGWQRCSSSRSFMVPAKVAAANKEYRKESDAVMQWLENRCKKTPDGNFKHYSEATPCFLAYESYKSWTNSNGRMALNETNFRREMEKLGFTKERLGKSQKVHYLGLILLPYSTNTNDEDE